MRTSTLRQDKLQSKSTALVRPEIWQLFGIWLTLRILTSLWAALVSPIHPLTPLELTIPLWPPSVNFNAWLARVWLAAWERWDAVHFIRIVEQGYQLENGSAQFHPLLAWLSMPFYWLTGNSLFALLLVSSVAALGLILAFERLALLDRSAKAARKSTLLFLLWPPAFIFFAPYTESLFVLWSILLFYAARQRTWWLAGLAGALATLTRQQGVFLLIPLAWELWEAADRQPRQVLRNWRDWLALGLIPAGLLIWIVYRAFILNDVQPDFSNWQGLLYSVMISPSSSKVVPVQAFWWPWQALFFALQKLWFDFEISLLIDLIVAAIFLGLTVLAWKSMRRSYQIYTVIIILVSFAYHTGPFYPYMGLPRHLLLAFPVFIGLSIRLRGRWQQLTMTVFSILGMAFLLMLYVIEGWVP